MLWFKGTAVTLEQIHAAYNKGQYSKALKICNKFLIKDPENTNALNMLFDIHSKMNDPEKTFIVYELLLSIFKKDNNIDKSIALSRKALRHFPKATSIHHNLAEQLKQKNLTAERIKVLLNLCDRYRENNQEALAVNVLKDAADVDENNLHMMYHILQRFDRLKHYTAFNECFKKTLEVAHRQSDIHTLEKLVEMAMDKKIDLTDTIPHTIYYFMNNEDKLGIFNDFAYRYLMKQFDTEFFIEFTHLNSFITISEMVEKLKDRYQSPDIYNYLLHHYVEQQNCENVENYFKEILNLPNFMFNNDYIQMLTEYIEKISQPEVLETLYAIAKRAHASDIQKTICSRLIELYEACGSPEKCDTYKAILDNLNTPEMEEEVITLKPEDYKDTNNMFTANLLYSSETSSKKPEPEPQMEDTFENQYIKLEDELDALDAEDIFEDAPPAPKKLDINRVSAVELMEIKGVSANLADAILHYRDSIGGIDHVDCLINVKGIGKKKLTALKEFVTVSI